MSVTNVTIPTAQSFLLVDTRTGPNKVLFLPTASTIRGRYLSIKDYYGGATASTLTISTTGLDRIDQRGISYTLASSFGSVMLLSDGLRSWNMMGLYEGGDTAIVVSGGVISATGGTITVAASSKYHVFTASGSFVISSGTTTVNYLVVGGGGGGGDRHGGGGGAGGVLRGSWTASVGTYTVTVGLGGIGGNFETNNSTPRGAGIKGGDSLLSGTGVSVTAFGGGGGGTLEGNPTGTVGSGGGGGGGGFAGIAGTAGQGNSGGSGLSPGGGGGGGAGGAGVSANTSTGGIGTTLYSTELLAVGYGTTFAAPTSPNTVISGGVASIAAGGGGAAASSPGPGGSGGLGGGGRGDWNSSFITNGTANTGGGGGGSRSHDEPSFGADGGSGLVLLWYSTVAPSGPVSWQYVRFSVVLARGQYSGREWQMSEFTLKYQGSAVSYTGATISPVVGGGEDNPNLIDGNLGNKAFNTSTSFTIFRASGFLFDAYTWATANDVPNRDPVRWILDASQDNLNWTVLDNKSTADQTITTNRNTYVQDFTL